MLYLLFVILFFLFFAAVSWRDFQFGLGLFLLILPSYLIRFQLGPIPSTVLEGAFLILLGIWIIRQTREKHWRASWQTIRSSVFFWPGLLLLLGAALSISWATDHRAALGIFKAYFIEPVLFYSILVTTIRSQKAWERLFPWLGGTVLFLCALAIVQRLTGWWSPTWEWTLPVSRRVTGLYTSPNALGLFVGPVALLYLGWLLVRQKAEPLRGWLKRYVVLVIAAALVAILLAVSRGALAAVILAVLLLLAVLWSKKKAGLLAVAGFILLLFIPFIRADLFSLASFQVASGQSRLALYQGSVQLLIKHPFKGLGLASFADRFESIRPADFTEKLIYPHSFYLNFWSETGILGLAAVLCMTVLVILVAVKSKNPFRWPFVAALFVVLLHGLVDVSYFKNDLAMLTWFLFAGIAAFPVRPLKEQI